MTPYVTAGAGFLLAVLWFDLMFDVQARRGPDDEGLASIAAYYGRVTTGAHPMNRLVAAVMAATLAAVIVQIADSDEPSWVAWTSLVLLGVPILLAGGRTVPRARRLGTRRDDVETQRVFARLILREHVVCFGAVAAVVVLQLGFAT